MDRIFRAISAFFGQLSRALRRNVEAYANVLNVCQGDQ